MRARDRQRCWCLCNSRDGRFPHGGRRELSGKRFDELLTHDRCGILFAIPWIMVVMSPISIILIVSATSIIVSSISTTVFATPIIAIVFIPQTLGLDATNPVRWR